MPVADTLLRLADEPAFYTPRCSSDILKELKTTLHKFGYTEPQIEHRIDQMQSAFPAALVEGYKHLLTSMKNNPEDRHVLAAAVRCGANGIVSNNKKHFPDEVLAEFDLECLTADEFIEHQYHLNPDLFINVLKQQGCRHWLDSTALDCKTCSVLGKTDRHQGLIITSVHTAIGEVCNSGKFIGALPTEWATMPGRTARLDEQHLLRAAKPLERFEECPPPSSLNRISQPPAR
jgi:predicted nucleic acid-binding protein